MAVFLEFVNVIVQKAAVARDFPGGLDGFAQQELPNLTEDEHLFRVGFMSTSEALGFVEKLEALGLEHLGEPNSPLAMVYEDSQVPWLTVGEYDGYSYACWLSAFPPGEMALPESGFLTQCNGVGSDWSKLIEQCGATLSLFSSSMNAKTALSFGHRESLRGAFTLKMTLLYFETSKKPYRR